MVLPVFTRSAVAMLAGILPLASPPVVPLHAGDAGDVVVVDALDPARKLTSGDTATPYSLVLPEAARCPGDSAHDQWQVHTFMAPLDDDPDRFEYDGSGPTGLGARPLYSTDSFPYIQVPTATNDTAGSPAAIQELPALDFNVFEPGDLASGDYRIGVACAYFRSAGPYWDTQIHVDVVGSAVHWTVSRPQGPVPGVGPARLLGIPIRWGALIVLIVSLVVLIAFRRRPEPVPHTRRTIP